MTKWDLHPQRLRSRRPLMCNRPSRGLCVHSVRKNRGRSKPVFDNQHQLAQHLPKRSGNPFGFAMASSHRGNDYAAVVRAWHLASASARVRCVNTPFNAATANCGATTAADPDNGWRVAVCASAVNIVSTLEQADPVDGRAQMMGTEPPTGPEVPMPSTSSSGKNPKLPRYDG